jgi:phosphoenolpyruvate synthase/pyruvate phosphate dikinase
VVFFLSELSCFLSAVEFSRYATILNVEPSHVFEAVKQCYASMWETRLFEYRKNVGFKSVESLAMAVVVQQQV